MPDAEDGIVPLLASDLLSSMPVGGLYERVYVALVDGELCAHASFRPKTTRYRWDVMAVAAGSPRLDATDDVCLELWSELLEYAIKQAGETGAKRLFATSDGEGVAYASLRRTGFEPYARFSIVTGFAPSGPIVLPEGMREQEDSDVWSIHQLHHHVTPPAVQFAEALTSAVWERPQESLLRRLGAPGPVAKSYVVDYGGAIQAYCRIEHRRTGAMARPMVADELSSIAVPFVVAAASQAGVPPEKRLRVLIPAYASELVTAFERAGFVVELERTAMVRHTTAPIIAYARQFPLPMEVAERVPRGVPTYLRDTRPTRVRSGGATTA